ncbi:kxDL motif-containing protein LO9-177 isoform X3 [Typha angustifolia]|uniref:kxDL motif-containing protein LO9-177 isoform X3 n=1 Tax=Typha angustifolia TaxID=59011 RepID=UPI003C2C148E
MERREEEESIRAASEEVARELKTLIDAGEVDSIKQIQHLILGRLQDSNAVLSHFNEYSERCFDEVSGDFARNTRLLKSMKSDLDHIFLKLSHVNKLFSDDDRAISCPPPPMYILI